MKNRIELAEYFKEMDFKVGAEVGVWDGRYAEILCQKNPGVKLYAIDSWQPYEGYRDHKHKNRIASAYELAKERLAPFNVTVIKKFSMDAVADFEDGFFDFVFIDGNHYYDWVRDDIREWTKKVRIGGIVSGHDYYQTPSGNVGVITAVDEYVKEHGYNLQIIDWDKSAEIIDDRQPSWFFLKTH